MQLLRIIILFFLLVLPGSLLPPAKAYSMQFRVSSTEATANSTITLDVTITPSATVSAALFKLTYNTRYLSLTEVESRFFDTFANQWDLLNPKPEPVPPASVEVDGQEYDRPLLFTNTGTGTVIVGVRAQAAVTESALLSLHFAIAPGTPDGIYPVTISPVTVDNSGLPVLVFMDSNEADPATACADLAPVLISGSIAVAITVVDSDHDGIDDAWEMDHFGDLETADATTDFDHDGYTDLQEYLNHLAGAVDANNNEFDPKKVNAPGGPGFTGLPSNPDFWILFNNVIQSAIRTRLETP